MKLGLALTLMSNVCVKSSNNRLTIRLSTSIAKINVERCVTLALVQGKKRNGRQAHKNSHQPLHKDDVLKGTVEKGFANCASAVDAQSFSYARLVNRDWNSPDDNVWHTREVAAELIPAVPQGLELSYRSEIDDPLWLGEW
jgi:hypothetical protein